MNCPTQRNHVQRDHVLLFVTCVAVGYLSALTPSVFAADAEEVVVSTAKDTPSEADKDLPSELSVAPLDHVEYPANRPAWLSNVPSLKGDIHTWVAATPACDNAQDANEMISVLCRAAVASYIESRTGESAERIEFPIEDAWIESKLISKRYVGEFKAGDAPQYEEAALLTFTPKVREQIEAAWKNFEVRQRLGALGLCVTGLFGTLMLGSGVLSAVGRRIQKRQPDEVASLV